MPPPATPGNARAAAVIATAPMRVSVLMRPPFATCSFLHGLLSAASLSTACLAPVRAEKRPSSRCRRVLRSTQMDFRILGSLEVSDGDHQLDLGGSKRRAVLALL